MSNTPYVLQHTVEEIDNKLNLIDENKNLLKYPYITNLADHKLPVGLTDIGDGSILTADISTGMTSILLATTLLPVGVNYVVSINITDIFEINKENSGFSLTIKVDGLSDTTTVDGKAILNLSDIYEAEAKTISVYLNMPDNFERGLLIKPQIEEDKNSGMPTAWVPNMDKIGTYVDRRFNSTNVKITEISKKADLLMRVSSFTEEQLNKMINLLDCIELA